ncbi:MAG: Flp pilus assembly protein CpaB [Pirellulales bacterium]|nr:Flp pilus assembly protein CpaB [Pirellulales bacterium]
MRPRSLILFGLALACGTIAAIGINQVLASRSQPLAADGPTQSIFVATTDVGMGTQLNAENVKLEPWPRDKVPAGAITKLEDLDGLRVRTRVFAGEPILAPKLLSRNANGSSASEMIPSGFRVVAVKVDDVSSTSSLIKPGDRVDVLVHLRANQNSGVHETATRTLLQNISVFAVNEVFQRPDEIDTGAIAARTVSLLVTPDQAELVTLATELGTIRLVLRSIEDEDIASTQGATTQHVTGRGTSAGSSRAESDAGLGGGDNPLLEMLNEQQTTVAARPAAAPISDINRWRMLLLEGAEMRHVHINPDGTQTSEPADSSGTRPLPVAPTAPDNSADETADEPPTEGDEATDDSPADETSAESTTRDETPSNEADGDEAADAPAVDETGNEGDGQSEPAPSDESTPSETESAADEPEPTV